MQADFQDKTSPPHVGMKAVIFQKQPWPLNNVKSLKALLSDLWQKLVTIDLKLPLPLVLLLEICHLCKSPSLLIFLKRVSKVKFTDLDSLIGNFECGYFTVWKFPNFSATVISREINFGQKLSLSQFWRLRILNFGKITHLKM